GFRLYWRWRSRSRGGRPRINEEVRALIKRIAAENPVWGAPRIHGEVQKLGFVLSERTVARYLRRMRRRGDPGQQWLTFLQNHREVTVAFDFFTVPHGYLPPALLLLRYRTRPPQDPALQCHPSSDCRLGHPAVTGGNA